MEVAEVVMKRSMEICSLMFGKILDAFDQSAKGQHATTYNK